MIVAVLLVNVDRGATRGAIVCRIVRHSVRGCGCWRHVERREGNAGGELAQRVACPVRCSLGRCETSRVRSRVETTINICYYSIPRASALTPLSGPVARHAIWLCWLRATACCGVCATLHMLQFAGVCCIFLRCALCPAAFDAFELCRAKCFVTQSTCAYLCA